MQYEALQNRFNSKLSDVFVQVERAEDEEKENDEEETYVAQKKSERGFRVLVEKNDSGKNTSNFALIVHDTQNNKWNIKRTLVDLEWLRDNLKKDFPFCYV